VHAKYVLTVRAYTLRVGTEDYKQTLNLYVVPRCGGCGG
jgi:hypothetical protein